MLFVVNDSKRLVSSGEMSNCSSVFASKAMLKLLLDICILKDELRVIIICVFTTAQA